MSAERKTWLFASKNRRRISSRYFDLENRPSLPEITPVQEKRGKRERERALSQSWITICDISADQRLTR